MLAFLDTHVCPPTLCTLVGHQPMPCHTMLRHQTQPIIICLPIHTCTEVLLHAFLHPAWLICIPSSSHILANAQVQHQPHINHSHVYPYVNPSCCLLTIHHYTMSATHSHDALSSRHARHIPHAMLCCTPSTQHSVPCLPRVHPLLAQAILVLAWYKTYHVLAEPKV